MREKKAATQRSPYRFLIAGAVLATMMTLMPLEVDAPQEATTDAETMVAQQEKPVGADLSERTQQGCYLHRTLYYAPCGHSVQDRGKLPAGLVGLSRDALEAQIGEAIPGVRITGFSAAEVDVAQEAQIPCPLHWMLKTGEDGYLRVMQNRSGEAMDTVRSTDVRADSLPAQAQDAMLEGMIFDDVQALEGYLESMGS